MEFRETGAGEAAAEKRSNCGGKIQVMA